MNVFIPVIAAGGLSSRLFPLTDEEHPKWLLNIGKGSLLEQTIERTQKIGEFEKGFVITNRKQKALISEELLEKTGFETVSEPSGKNTYATFVLGCWLAYNQNPESIVGFFPADHYIKNQNSFVQTLNQALVKVDSNLVVVGIKPTFASESYGYIHGDGDKVENFTEKPTTEVAEKYLESGGYFWNAGIFVTKAEFIVNMITEIDPTIIEVIGELRQNNNSKLWDKLHSISVDYKLIEPISKEGYIKMVVSQFDWSDVGDFESLKQTPLFDLKQD